MSRLHRLPIFLILLALLASLSGVTATAGLGHQTASGPDGHHLDAACLAADDGFSAPSGIKLVAATAAPVTIPIPSGSEIHEGTGSLPAPVTAAPRSVSIRGPPVPRP